MRAGYVLTRIGPSETLAPATDSAFWDRHDQMWAAPEPNLSFGYADALLAAKSEDGGARPPGCPARDEGVGLG